MFTPQEVSEKTFPKSASFSSGYNMASVDEFLDALTEDYTALYKENAALKTKLKILAEKMEEYRATEDAMRSTLLAAQKMAAAMTEEAKETSEKVLQDARQESQRMLEEAKNSAETINRDLAWKTENAQRKYNEAKASMEDFIARNLAMCLQQVEYLERLPHSELPVQEEAASAAPEDAPTAEAVSAEESAGPEDSVMTQDTVRIIEKDILAAYEEQTKKEEPLPADTDFRSEFKLDLDELKFGRNYDPGK